MDRTSNGLSLNDVAKMACDVLERAANLPEMEWDRRDDKFRWESVAVKAIALMDPGPPDRPRDIRVSAKDMAKVLYFSYSLDEAGWDILAKEAKLAWEAVARHLFGAFVTEDLSTVQNYESARKFVESKLGAA